MQNILTRLVEIDMSKVELHDSIIHLEWLIQSKEGHLKVAESV